VGVVLSSHDRPNASVDQQAVVGVGASRMAEDHDARLDRYFEFLR
jgi:hypothetical protein